MKGILYWRKTDGKKKGYEIYVPPDAQGGEFTQGLIVLLRNSEIGTTNKPFPTGASYYQGQYEIEVPDNLVAEMRGFVNRRTTLKHRLFDFSTQLLRKCEQKEDKE